MTPFSWTPLVSVMLGVVSLAQGFYYQSYQPMVMLAESSLYPSVYQSEGSSGQNAYSAWQASRVPLMVGEESSRSEESVCQSGFVEHCLMQANQDGEQRLLEVGSNGTSDLMAKEFDGMCHVVIRFIDCLNQHYVRCNQPTGSTREQSDHQLANMKDMFYQSWTKLCSSDGHTRKKYLEHSKCIKNSLAQNSAQEQCQARFQGYFMSGQFQLDSIDSTVQYGCCAFNEWQYCIDTLIARSCGHDAMKAVQDLIEQASGGLVSSLCDKKLFARKSKACMGKKTFGFSKLQTLDSKVNATLHKYISIFGDFIDRLPDEEDDQEQEISSK